MLRIASCALGAVAVLLLAPSFEAAAKSGGARFGGVRAFHGAAHAGAHRGFAHRGFAHRGFAHRGFAQQRFPLLAGAVWPGSTYDPYYGYGLGYADDGQTGSVIIVRPPEPPRVLTCKRIQETVTVPSEYVGSREITVTRC
jgi:hypothetical protein